MKLIITTVDEAITKAMEKAFLGNDRVTIMQLPIQRVVFDIANDGGATRHLGLDPKRIACISPANSFGWMDGGVDQFLLNMFGNDLQTRLRDAIARNHDGELEIGQAEAVRTVHPFCAWIIAAPTMRMPEPIPGTMNVYRAFTAALELASALSLQGIVAPAMGAGTGRMSPEESAGQMAKAWNDVAQYLAINK